MSEQSFKPADIALWIGFIVSLITAFIMPWVKSAIQNARDKTKSELRDELVEKRLDELEDALSESTRDIKTVISNSDMEVKRVMEKMERRLSGASKGVEEVRGEVREFKRRFKAVEDDYYRRLREDQEYLASLRRGTKKVGALNLPKPGTDAFNTE